MTDNLGAQDVSDPVTITAQSPGGGTGYSASVLADSPAAYWRLGEASGTTRRRRVGQRARGLVPEYAHARAAAERSPATPTPRSPSTAPTSTCRCPTRRPLNPATFTVEAWAYRDGRPGHLPLAGHEPRLRRRQLARVRAVCRQRQQLAVLDRQRLLGGARRPGGDAQPVDAPGRKLRRHDHAPVRQRRPRRRAGRRLPAKRRPPAARRLG